MSDIQVNTSDLRNGSQVLNDASDKIGDAQSHLGRLLGNIGNAYDGQLRQSIEGAIGGSPMTGSRLQSRARELANELNDRSNRFESANQVSYSAMLTPIQYFNNLQRSSSIWRMLFLLNPLSLKRAAFLLTIGGLGLGIHTLISFISKPDNRVPQQPAPPPAPTPSSMPRPLVTPPKDVPNRIEVAMVNENADATDCFAFARGQREVPPGVTRMNGGWAGGYRNDAWNYGNLPKPGALMVEAKSNDPIIGATIGGVAWGHVSYVKSVEYDGSGQPVKFTVVEGGWGNPKGKHEETFDWPISNSQRRPEVFVYEKK
jgi:uncharacterized protein YukE